MIQYSRFSKVLFFSFALMLAALPAKAQLLSVNSKKIKPASESGTEQLSEQGLSAAKDKPRENEMWVRLTNASLSAWGKDGGDFKYWWTHKLAREAVVKKSWASVKFWYNNNESLERISEEISLDTGNGLIKIPPKGDYYPVRYEIKIYVNYKLYDKPHSMSDMKYGKLPYRVGKDEPVTKPRVKIITANDAKGEPSAKPRN
jgi:hypothetical protein